MKRTIWTLALVLTSSPVWADVSHHFRGGTVNAASCSRNDVNAAIASASDGQIVTIPNGSCTWTTGISDDEADLDPRAQLHRDGRGRDRHDMHAPERPDHQQFKLSFDPRHDW